jgi:sugar phosphate isomerase/epimerase
MLDRPPLSLALAAMRSAEAAHPRWPLELAAESGLRFVTLDGAAPGMRARELDRSGRRDLAALLRRLELGCAGVDLWIPPGHFADPDHADRAVSAVLDALDLVADVAELNGGPRLLSLTLPRERGPVAGAVEAIAARADARSVVVADHAWPPAEGGGVETIACGLDPASLLLAGENPAKVAARLGRRIAAARLSDAGEVSRVVPGSRDGRLNDLAYVVALETAGYGLPLILDLRGVASPEASVAPVLSWWSGG